jgi:spore coat polysaccharide biosynthesis protein SpsF
MIVAIVQARMGSTRLPGKVMREILGKPVLWHLINRLKQATLVDKIVIATSDKEADFPIIRFAEDIGMASFVGSEQDVLDRYYQTATKFGADVIIRITADCVLIDPKIVDKVVQRYLRGDCDYAANTIKCTYPDGQDVEVFSYTALKKAWQEAKWASEREHVTPYIRKNPEKFRLVNIEYNSDLSHLRWSVDEEKDLEFVRQVYQHLFNEEQIFHMQNILDLLDKYPELMRINKGIPINEGYAKSLKEDRVVN